MLDRRSGFALIEAIAAIAILGTALIVAVTLISQSIHAVEQARLGDRKTVSAQRALEQVMVMHAEQLEARVGLSQLRGWNLRVEKPDANLFIIGLSDAHNVFHLSTARYMSETANAHR